MTQLAVEYGTALFELAKEENLLSRLDEELAALDRIFQEEKGYLSLLSSRALPLEERLRILDESIGELIILYSLFCGQAPHIAKNFLKIFARVQIGKKR